MTTDEKRAYDTEYRRKNLEKRRAQNRAWYQANREKCIAKTAEWSKKNPDKRKEQVRRYSKKHASRCSAATRAWYQKNRERSLIQARCRQLRKTYGITLERHQAMLAEQGGKCPICETAIKGKNLPVDHCHASGKVRAILCNNCNAGLGMFADNLNSLRRAIAYLEKHGQTTALT